jgi:hypothetical protein
MLKRSLPVFISIVYFNVTQSIYNEDKALNIFLKKQLLLVFPVQFAKSSGDNNSPILAEVKKAVVIAALITCLEHGLHLLFAILYPIIFSTNKFIDLWVPKILFSVISRFLPASLPGLTVVLSSPAMFCAVANAVRFALVVFADNFLDMMHQVAKPL